MEAWWLHIGANINKNGHRCGEENVQTCDGGQCPGAEIQHLIWHAVNAQNWQNRRGWCRKIIIKELKAVKTSFGCKSTKLTIGGAVYNKKSNMEKVQATFTEGIERWQPSNW
eukprot:Gb_20303 [translate_table: standard]